MELLGLFGLLVFFGVIIASLKEWIPQDVLPVQSALILTTLFLVVIAALFGQPINLKELSANIYIHPITALLAGFLVAGALEAAGAFKAAIDILERLAETPLGLPGTVVILVNMPTIFAMPCGRILAAALIPAALLFGYELARVRETPLLVSVVIFGFIVNAAASCGPSPLGGIGTMGEGMGGYDIGSLANAQQVGIMVITAVAMVSIKLIYRILPGETIIEEMMEENEQKKKKDNNKVPASGYFSFFFFLIGIAVVFITKPPVPIQTILVFFVIVIMLISRVSIQDLIGGVILHPVMAMISGFIIAGALIAIGSFDALIELLSIAAEMELLPGMALGYVGVAVILANTPSILPMPCGRIMAAALMPGVLLFGLKVSEATGNALATPILLTGFILNAAASCGPSPLGGIGGIGEGNLGTAIGISGKPQQVGIMMGTGIAVLIIGLLGFI
ncbi:MAG: hypothetical protein B6U97_02975 [Candidatus Altiarchaeales archaeon ex4484_96]|nr:MAG: hypothetical protein B6U97_02975 [Candidatus Altiarchaeales archaeon ex4484_96]